MLIGICGKAGSGKDTIADHLIKQHGFKRIALADPIKRLVKDVFVLDDFSVYDREAREKPLEKWPNWTVRKLLQFIGTDLFRTHIDDSIWVKSLWQRIQSDKKSNYVISDLRFPNELQFFRDNASAGEFFCIKVIRKGYDGSVGLVGHASEAYDLKGNYEIANDGTIEELNKKVDDCLVSYSVDSAFVEIPKFPEDPIAKTLTRINDYINGSNSYVEEVLKTNEPKQEIESTKISNAPNVSLRPDSSVPIKPPVSMVAVSSLDTSAHIVKNEISEKQEKQEKQEKPAVDINKKYIKIYYKDRSDNQRDVILPIDEDFYNNDISYKENVANIAYMILGEDFAFACGDSIIPSHRIVEICCHGSGSVGSDQKKVEPNNENNGNRIDRNAFFKKKFTNKNRKRR